MTIIKVTHEDGLQRQKIWHYFLITGARYLYQAGLYNYPLIVKSRPLSLWNFRIYSSLCWICSYIEVPSVWFCNEDSVFCVISCFSLFDSSGLRILAALLLWLFTSSVTSTSALLVLVTKASLGFSGNRLDGFEDETNKGFAAGCKSWSKALKLAQPTSFVSVVAFVSNKCI